MITSSTSSGFTCARSSAPMIAALPRSCAGTWPNAPLNEPTGVRAALAMTISVAIELLLTGPAASRWGCYRRAAMARKLGAPGEAVGAPVVAADPVMDEEQPLGIVFLLHHAQTAVVAAPIGRLPVLLEVARFGDIGAVVGRELRHLGQRRADGGGLALGPGEIGLVTRDAGKGRRTRGGDDHEREGIEHRGIGRGVARGRNGFRRRTGEALVEVELERPLA